MLKSHFSYFKYVVRHKWFVFVAGRKTGVPLHRLIFHDWTKFTPAEWTAYVHQFYAKDRKRPGAFQKAWMHHWHRNDHHWQHWVDLRYDGSQVVIPMPDVVVREMVADWMGAGRAITGKWEVGPWYAENRDKMWLHPDTRKQVDALVEHMA